MRNVPVLSRDQVRQLDRLAIDTYGIPGLILMENAGRGCVDVLRRLGVSGPVVIACGAGNNAGDGLVMARHLDQQGIAVRLLFWRDPADFRGDAAANYAMVCRADLPRTWLRGPHSLSQMDALLDGAEWIVDALLGTGARGDPRQPMGSVIDRLNSHPAKKLALDIPSGLDCDSGQPGQPTLCADHTCTFVAAKPGLLRPAARPFVGRLHLVAIGVPGMLLDQFDVERGFGSEPIVGGS